MRHPVSRIAIVLAIIKKDTTEFSRDKLFSVLSILAIITYVVLFRLMPATVDEKLHLGVHHGGEKPLLALLSDASAEGIVVHEFPSCPDLISAVSHPKEKGKETISMGICFPEGFVRTLKAGERPTLHVYGAPGIPPEMRRIMGVLAQDVAYAVMGGDLPVTLPDEAHVILGRDRSGDQVPLRDRMLPFLAVMVLFTESLVLASLIAGEIQNRTLVALRITPAAIGDIVGAKALFGTLLAFSQTLIMLMAMGVWWRHWAPLSLFIFFGALMAAGVGMLVGAVGKDFMGTLLWGMIWLILLCIPAVASLFPGSVSFYVKALPSYGVVQGVMDLTTPGGGWERSGWHLGLVCLWDSAILGTGITMLKKRGDK